ncbi:10718_t:CDS:10 [Acaulospora morrowiae]|uniref:10718_t:CDS:1 n=1 Tax=Acaulospora morrowiae TaxID=94023 RepID=A0A9N9AQ73_9GLOM|nr:10718_t:CDS:10 [Acaulospora morrowiae]
MNQQQQSGYTPNSLGLSTNPAVLQQQTQPQQYANNFNSHQTNQRPMNIAISQQSQQATIERNYGAVNNRNIQQIRNLGGESGANLTNQYLFQNRQSLPATSATPMPSIPTMNNTIYGNNMTTNMLGFPSQSNINNVGLDVFQSGFNRSLGQMMQQQMIQQIRRPVQNSTTAQNIHHRSSHQKQTGDISTKKSQSSSSGKSYEPAPDLTPVQKQYLEQYVRRDLLYQQALDIQSKRQMSIINEKRREIERHQTRSGILAFGPGYEGYGNGLTGTRFRIVYPNERKRHKKTREFKFSHQQLRDIAEKEDNLVPIRLEIDGADGYKLRDTFTWNVNETCITPEHFAEVLCDDLRFPASTFAPLIVKQIRDQLQGYILHPLSSTKPPTSSLTADVFSDLKTSSSTDDGENDSELTLSNDSMNECAHEELRILIKIDVTVGNISLVDQFEWDINCQKNDPELFAEILTTELGLGGEFKTAIAHSIREQIQIYVKSLILVGHQFDGSQVQDDDLRQSLLPPVTNIIRREDAVDQHTPLLRTFLYYCCFNKPSFPMRQDREPPKTHRTLLHNTTMIQDPADENSLIPVLSSGMPPVQRKASSMGYDNYSAISEKSSTTQGKIRGRGRTGINGSNLRGGIQSNTLDIIDGNNFGRSGSVGLSPPKESKEGTKRPHRRLASKELEEWQCDGCGCPSTSTPLLRKGPNGEKTLCNACGLYFQKNNSLRPNPLNTNDAGVSLLHTGHNSSPITTISANNSHVKSHQNNPVPHTHYLPTMLIGHNPSVQNASLDAQQQSNTSAEKLLPSQKLQEIKNQDNKIFIDSKEIPVSSTAPQIAGTSVPHFIHTATTFTSHITANSAEPVSKTTSTTSNMAVHVAIHLTFEMNYFYILKDFPEWTIPQCEQLQRKYPHDHFDIIQQPNHYPAEFLVKCFDCPGKLYKLGPDLTLGNFEIHLKNKRHRLAVEKRLRLNQKLTENTLNNEISNSNTVSRGGHNDHINIIIGNKDSGRSISVTPVGSSAGLASDNSSIRSMGNMNRYISKSKDEHDSSNEVTAVGVFIDNRNGIPQTPKPKEH